MEVRECKFPFVEFVLTGMSSLAKFINAYKSASSRIIKKEFPEIRKQLWKEYFCRGYKGIHQETGK
jgi:REP element-mobilizing transposase RayT